MKLSEIVPFPSSIFEVDVSWEFLDAWIAEANPPLDLDPDYQRGHVWGEAQQVAYLEYVLKGGEVGRNIVTNCPGWKSAGAGLGGPYELVDGLQRITAVRCFMRDEVRVFGRLRSEIQGSLRLSTTFRWRVLDLPTRADVLKLYLAINAGGTPHTREEIARVQALLQTAEAQERLGMKPGPRAPGSL